jgi:hypothetical protein
MPATEPTSWRAAASVVVATSSVATMPGEIAVTRRPGLLSNRNPSVIALVANLVALYTALIGTT